jgi:ribosomal-protein-alanine N-acetyltransferase
MQVSKQHTLPLDVWTLEVTCFGRLFHVTNDNSQQIKLKIGRCACKIGTQAAWDAAAAACQAITTMELAYSLTSSADKEDGQVVRTQIRTMRWPEDAEAALWIEQTAFINPLGPDGFIAMLNQPNSYVLVAGVPGVSGCVAGYVHITKHDSGWELHNIAVDSHFRRLGVGRSLVDHVKRYFLNRERSHLFCTVREQNLEGQLFFKSNGLRCVSIVKHHYVESPEPAYFFRHVRQFS